MQQKKGQKGFSLIELLIVVAIIGIIAAIAIPNLLNSRRASNEGAAIGTMRTLGTAQATYLSTTGGNVSYAKDLAELKGAGLIDDVLAGSKKSGYTFLVAGGGAAFTADATPDTATMRHFFTDESGVIRWKAGADAGAGDPAIQ